MTKISRREALRGVVTGGALFGAASCGTSKPAAYQSGKRAPDSVFAHGIASGDPLQDGFIIWTRIVAAEENAQTAAVKWEVSEHPDFAAPNIVASGEIQPQAASDWTIKADVRKLKPATTYFYRFITAQGTSPIGKTKTLPDGPIDQARFAIVSCASWPHGFFNGYDHIARNPDFDAVIHLGDYIYEYGIDGYGGAYGKKIGRNHEPSHEAVTLADYRMRHAQYKTDTDLQAMHAAHPVILLWDDHEVANNSWEGGAQNHQLDEGQWEDRRRAAMQAYYEWMPVREATSIQDRHHLYKAYRWGDLLTIATIETRLTARAEQIEPDEILPPNASVDEANNLKNNLLGAKDRYLLGDAQLDFVTQTLKQSKQRGEPWRLIANQVLMSKVSTPDLTPYVSEEVMQSIEKDWPGIRNWVTNSVHRLPLYSDTWSGYPWARERLYNHLADNGVDDILVLTGDAHEFWANDLYDNSGSKMGVELGTSSITSQTVEEYLGDATADMALLITRENNEVRYYDPLAKGYIDLTLTHKGASAEMIGLSTVLERDYTAQSRARFTLTRKKGSVHFNGAKDLNLKQRFLYMS
ncbi:MAG: alkaline phosphatase D family protein [bacterium]